MENDEARGRVEQMHREATDGTNGSNVGTRSACHDSGTQVFAGCHAVFNHDTGMAGHLPHSICPNFRKRTITEVELHTQKHSQQQKQKQP